MGRPPCCDKVGVKKGPWTPEEDIILVSYIQEHGPGNWRSVPTNTGLLRCSKSCRLRWTNYLRPGIKRGNFTPHEEGMIIHLQALLGNKWAAIASYLPQRTDNDIKNYWNTHLKKKLKKFQSNLEPVNNMQPYPSFVSNKSTSTISSFNGSSVITNLKNSSSSSSPKSSSTYASSTENISRLLEGWMRSSPKSSTNNNNNSNNNNNNNNNNVQFDRLMKSGDDQEAVQEEDVMVCHEEFDHHSILSFDNDVSSREIRSTTTCDEAELHKGTSGTPPLSFLEKWLLDESSTTTAGASTIDHAQEMMELSPIF